MMLFGDSMTNFQHDSNEVADFLPLSPVVFFVLFALADGEKHGYLIMQQVSVLSDGKLRMGPATLYTTIQRLVDQLLVEETNKEAGGRRRYYRLTKLGQALLRAELDRQAAVLRLARSKKLIPLLNPTEDAQ
jgi:DNA-binding PadR family transcriptional regulator